ncbi:hypothetical protein [Acinetobacter higginsii]|uniref:hypothetical protein n=1 Tax=Acinetobacter higginsii TaxID=70347 RepID=UPI001F4A481C|nr:hypothetical protein [Acinetobacter higginsii]MCH7381195.1 hypothetical protein [Acinetobacter higginsii]
MKNYQVWLEGYAATGEQQPAQFVGVVNADNFENAIEILLKQKEWDMKFFNIVRGTPVYWGCRFFDNETDARKSFG